MSEITDTKGNSNTKGLGLKQFFDEVENSNDEDILGCQRILQTSALSWVYLPEYVLMVIFKRLSGKDLANAVQVCSRWRMVGDSEKLWEKKLKQDFDVQEDVSLRSGAHSWKKEYERLYDNVPCVMLKKIEKHVDEVLHVSFSHNGMMFCTCSKDAYVKVYSADWPFETVFSERYSGNMFCLKWKYTQWSQFNSSDTQLLVSGRTDALGFGGEIVIYNILGGVFSVQARERILPYDVMGTWLNETHFLSAVACERTFQFVTEVVLHKSAQELENCHHLTQRRDFIFLTNGIVQILHVADIAKHIRQVVKRHFGSDLKDFLHEMHIEYLTKKEKLPISNLSEDFCGINHTCSDCNAKSDIELKVRRCKSGSPLYGEDSTADFSFCSENKLRERDAANPDPHPFLKSCGVLGSDTDSLAESSGSLQQNPSVNFNPELVQEASQVRARRCVHSGKLITSLRDDVLLQSEINRSSAASADGDLDPAFLLHSYKLLVCLTGHSCVPHQIGVKIIEKEECDQRDITEQLGGFDISEEPDDWDCRIELYGQGAGMTLSPCNRYLYVNVRRWVGDWKSVDPEDFLDTALSNEIQLLVFDLVKMEQVSILTGHNAGNELFFFHLSSDDYYVASGSGDDCGYIWDRHYGTRIAVLPHENVVNSVAVNPRDPSMAVSVSDDHSIKIWRSKAFSRLQKNARPELQIQLPPCSSQIPES